jgi:type IV pilus biogenesis protein CpaD/CtpE
MVIKAVAVEQNKTIEVLSDAPGRARRFHIKIGNWRNVRGSVRATAIGARVIEELKKLGVRAEIFVVRTSYSAVVLAHQEDRR